MPALVMTEKLIFVSRLAELMEARGLNNSELSREADVAVGTIRNLLKRQQLDKIDRGTTEKLMRFFGCSFEDLYSIRWDND